MVGILALESQRNRCIVVGEDLAPCRKASARRWRRPASCRTAWFFECRGGRHSSRRGLPELALSRPAATICDAAGWWEEHDIDLKERHGLIPAKAKRRAARPARRDKQALLDALEEAKLALPHGFTATSPCGRAVGARSTGSSRKPVPPSQWSQIDELIDEPHQVNLPATTDQHPNWRRKQSVSWRN